ncbi:transposase [Plectonema cf. radiosum LEGE 06105]|uniref:Transposase n=1 Tax=Plectonema cf. radiosum LEGE 06105 TaxID=945769 RepID=A0A8J7F336_9CYAN|nr:RNA-guided endonuclease TnpB family protein [Plectonema radiosum]MBE9215331.1 transposase [Plectonema cf. radiosum LEGE 06105]
MSSYGCQQHLINPSSELAAILEFLCSESAKLANCGTYYARQLYFKTGKIPSKFDLHKLFKSNLHFQAMYSHVAQQCLTTVTESFKSYIGLLKGTKKGTVDQRPKLPGYRKGGLALVTYPKADVKLKDGLLRFPLGSKVKTWFGLDAFYIRMPSNLNFVDIKEFRILPRNKCFYIEYVYKQHDVAVELDQSKVLGIDHGLNNWLTCVTNVSTSFIIDGKHLKSMNQWFNKQVSTIKENKPQGFWNEKLAHITEKRNRQVRDAVNKAARLVINHCLDNKIGTLVFGWNKGQKDGADMGKKNNQKFVQIPTARLKDRIAQLCEQYGIKFVETEESYTSKSSFLDNDVLPRFGEKPERWQSSGKRIKRGLFKTQSNILVNADANGAANIIAKVAIKLGLELSGISRVSLIAPLKVRLWTLQESPGF